jgi:hypothetical protein
LQPYLQKAPEGAVLCGYSSCKIDKHFVLEA